MMTLMTFTFITPTAFADAFKKKYEGHLKDLMSYHSENQYWKPEFKKGKVANLKIPKSYKQKDSIMNKFASATGLLDSFEVTFELTGIISATFPQPLVRCKIYGNDRELYNTCGVLKMDNCRINQKFNRENHIRLQMGNLKNLKGKITGNGMNYHYHIADRKKLRKCKDKYSKHYHVNVSRQGVDKDFFIPQRSAAEEAQIQELIRRRALGKPKKARVIKE